MFNELIPGLFGGRKKDGEAGILGSQLHWDTEKSSQNLILL